MVFSSIVWADSPITSTSFAVGYADELIVQSAAQAKGVLTVKLSEYLADSKNPIDVKMAVISRLGWNIKGTKNSQIYFAFLSKKFGYKTGADFLEKGFAEDLLVMAYLRARSDYFRVKIAFSYAEKALSLNPKSRTFNLVHALIKAQIEMDDMSKWCEVFQLTDRVRKNTELTNDIREEAVKDIYEYMDSYAKYCSSNPPSAEEEEDLPPPSVYEFKLRGKWRDSTNLSDFVNPEGNYTGDTTFGWGQTLELFGDTRYTKNSRDGKIDEIVENNTSGTFSADEKYLTFKRKSGRLRSWDMITRKITTDQESILRERKYRYLLENGEKDGEKVLSLWSPEDEAKFPNSPTIKLSLAQ